MIRKMALPVIISVTLLLSCVTTGEQEPPLPPLSLPDLPVDQVRGVYADHVPDISVYFRLIRLPDLPALPQNEIIPIPPVLPLPLVISVQEKPVVPILPSEPIKKEPEKKNPEKIKKELPPVKKDPVVVPVQEKLIEKKELPVTEQDENPVLGKPGSPLEIRLPGRGWIYIPGKTSDDIRFVDKRIQDGDTLFIFVITRDGLRKLHFQSQDSETGKISEKDLTVQIGSGLKATPVKEQDVTIPDITEESDPYDLFLQGIKEKNRNKLVKALSSQTINLEVPDESLIEALRILLKSDTDTEITVPYLEKVLSLFPEDMDLTPELLFAMGQLLERPSPYRDLKKAYRYYSQVAELYPVSRFSDLSQERINYLDRHYFKIR